MKSEETCKPCPICGEQPEIKHRIEKVDIKWICFWSVRCDSFKPVNHFVDVTSPIGGSREEAIEAWNTRWEDQ